jgi:O-glycosyl hydrolase
VSAFAAVDDAGGKLTIVLINKNAAAASPSMSIANFNGATTAQTYRYVAQSGAQLAKGADLMLASGGPTALSLPAHSMTLIVVTKP